MVTKSRRGFHFMNPAIIGMLLEIYYELKIIHFFDYTKDKNAMSFVHFRRQQEEMCRNH